MTAAAQKTVSYEGADEVVRLWDNTTAKYSNYETRDEEWRSKKKTSIKQTSSCEIYIFKADPAKNTGVAVCYFPGGSYTNLNLTIWLAKWYASQGITVGLVKYRLPNGGHTDATLEDAMGAVRYMRTRTDLGINPQEVGVSGSSAGGHLSTWVSNAMADDEKPAFAIINYGWINIHQSNSAAADKALDQLLGKERSEKDLLDLTTFRMVSRTTPPTMLLLCDNDALVPSVDAANYYEQLVNHGVKAAMHIYPFGGHSIKHHKPEFQSAVIEWLKYLGMIEK